MRGDKSNDLMDLPENPSGPRIVVIAGVMLILSALIVAAIIIGGNEIQRRGIQIERPTITFNEKAVSKWITANIYLIIAICTAAVNIVFSIWVCRDAYFRGDSAMVLWTLLTLFLPIFGFVFYCVSREKGALARCKQCNRFKIATSDYCPHCSE